MAEIDPITLAVVWNSMINICEEMGYVLCRTAYSEAVREAQDMSTALFDPQGRLVAQGVYTPGHLGAMRFALGHALRAYPAETLRPGDGILLNDIAMGAGHLPDMFSFTPVFHQGRLVAFTGSSAHHIDVGGAAPGSQAVEGIVDTYQEGLRIIPVKYFENDRPVEQVFKFIEANVRVPEKVVGDIKAQMNANRIGGLRICALIEKYGLPTFNQCLEEMIRRSEAAMRASIREIPDGTYAFEDYLDDVGRNTDPVKVRVTVTIEGDEVAVDFTGSGPQTESGINCYINFTYAYALYSLRSLTDPTIPQNEGCFRPLKVVAPEGSFFNPRHPAPGGGRAIIANRIVDCIMSAMSQALPQRAIAACSHFSNATVGGLDPRTGRPFVYYDLLMGGFGARPVKDGIDGIASGFNTGNIPVEVYEINYPVLIERQEYIPDSAGAGKYRGGTGIRKDVRILTEKVRLTCLSDRQRFVPFGLFGGGPGALGATILNPGPNETRLHSKGVYPLLRGDVISFRVSGSGGWGHPSERDPQAVLRDVRDGLVSAEQARNVYGVAIDTSTWTVLAEETAALRAGVRTGGHSGRRGDGH
ncbi:MAG: hydantoinase B/oxoprolinase family protein [Armatimonadetes bacterium]|nr:hydantoinase B/oxoprolinase family protein [Armatimonadota bacterium]